MHFQTEYSVIVNKLFSNLIYGMILYRVSRNANLSTYIFSIPRREKKSAKYTTVYYTLLQKPKTVDPITCMKRFKCFWILNNILEHSNELSPLLR